jgi:hypothetical protein
MKGKYIFLALFVTGMFFSNNTTAKNLDTDGWDISALDTARKVSYLSDLEKDVILELNKARSDPKKYAEMYIRPRLAWFQGSPWGDNYYLPPGKTTYIGSDEGKKGLASCIADLAKRSPLKPLAVSEALSSAARDHVRDIGPKGQSGHQGSDGSDPSQRAKRYGLYGCGENISFGESTARDIIIQLLVDDGVPSRGHRTNCLNPEYTIVGTSAGAHKSYGFMCVLDFYW